MEKFLWVVMIPLMILWISLTGDEGPRREGLERTPPPPPKTIELEIKKVHNKWKVVVKNDSTAKEVRANRKDIIKWTAVGSDVYFQFMDTLLVGRYTDEIKDGKTKPLTLGNKAPLGKNVYAVFCVTDKKFAEGESPPTIIIE